VTGRVDQVDQELVLLGLLGNVLEVLGIVQLSEQRDGSRLDGDTTLLLVGTSICETGGTGVGGRDNTSTLDERVGEGGLAVVDCGGVGQRSVLACARVVREVLTVGNDGHVTDVRRVVHESTEL
jgi:hypothetical protein